MRAVLMQDTGGPEVLSLGEIERPEPADGEVLIRIRAASVNPIDWKYRRGYMPRQLPTVLGQDVSGSVEESRADAFAAGDEVFGSVNSGAYAEFGTATASAITNRPSALSDEVAAAIPTVGITAWQALFDRGELQPGQTVLIAGAAGGVGHLAVQFAKHAGARVIGTGSGRNREFVLGLGADDYVDYTQQDVGQAVSGVDLVFDTVGGENPGALLPAVRDGGTIVEIAGAPPEEAARERGVRAELLVSSPNPEQLARIAELVAAGEVHVEIAEVLPLAEVRRAHEQSESGHSRGKIVLQVE